QLDLCRFDPSLSFLRVNMASKTKKSPRAKSFREQLEASNEKLRRLERHAQFVNDLDLELSQISGPEDELIALMTSRLGEYLEVNRCFLCEIDSTNTVVTVRENWQGWLRGVPSLAREFQIADYYTRQWRDQQEKGR